MRTLKLVFPGRRYSKDRSLLYFLDQNINGDTIYMDYDVDRSTKDVISIEDNIKEALSCAIKKLDKVDFSSYDEIILIAKSIGTVIAGDIREKYKLNNARFICLTPLNETVKYIRQTDFIVCGSEDKYIDKIYFEKFKFAYPFFSLYEGLPHSLEYSNNLKKTFQIQERIIDEAINYLDTSLKDMLGNEDAF